jgi:wyosine [tRNA(Phe)-imidazoG37] synthetase (radical SAM superfamily)
LIQKTASKRSSNRRFLYGPVPSRRLGYSLGIDLIPFKTCTYNCVYCQLGKTTNQAVKQKRYVQPDKILRELRRFLNLKTRIDYITLSGSGEPTLNSGIGTLIRKIKRITKIPVAVVTNSSIIYKNNVQKNLLNADVIMPTLTSVQERTFKRIHRTAPGITEKLIIHG